MAFSPRSHKMARPHLFIDAQHGLGNRLRAIASAAAIAHSTERELVVIWEPDMHCEANLLDLLDYDLPILNDGGDVRDLMKERSDRVYNYMEIEADSKFDEPILADRSIISGDIYVRSAYSLKSPHIQPTFEDNFLRSLRPTREVAEMVASVLHPSRVAVHIRMASGQGFEHLSYESPENWPTERHAELLNWRRMSHVDRFIARLDRLVSEEGNLSIFVAADTPETYAILIDRYGNDIRFLPRTLFDRSSIQVQTALADMMLLTSAPLFLASGWSSFSDVAQRLARPGRLFEKSGVDF